MLEFAIIIIPIFLSVAIYNFFFDTENNMESILYKMSSFFKRKRAFKFSANFLTKGETYYRLQNNYVTITIDKKGNTLKCYNRKNNKESISVDWRLQREYLQNLYNEPRNSRINELFDDIAISFYSATTYKEIANEIILNFETITETKDPEKAPTYEIEIGPNTVKEKLLNINEATEQEIIDLPGINVAHAKKIIKYRDLHNGFKNLEEFYKEMKIKPHFIEKLNKIICVEACVKTKKKPKSNERIIDL